jgi:hypothetical protein
MRSLERNEERVLISMYGHMVMGKQVFSADDLLARNVMLEGKSASHGAFLAELTRGSSTLTLKKGVGQLVDALAAALHSSDKVEVKTIKQDPETSDITVCWAQYSILKRVSSMYQKSKSSILAQSTGK